MSAIDSWRDKQILAIGWLVFVVINLWLMFAMAKEATIPDHLIWASFAFVYGLVSWSRLTTTLTFWGITVVTSVPVIMHAASGSSVH